MARRKPETMIEADDIRESETVATAGAKGIRISDLLARPVFDLPKTKLKYE